MGLAASSRNYKTQNEDGPERYSDDSGSIDSCGNGTGMFDLSDKHTICSVSQYLRILMSDKMLNEHIDQMNMPPQIVGIDDIEWRSPYAKNRFEDIQMLESAGNLPQADKYYTGALQRVAQASEKNVWEAHKKRTLIFMKIHNSLRRLRQSLDGNSKIASDKHANNTEVKIKPSTKASHTSENSKKNIKKKRGKRKNKKISPASFCINAITEFTSLQLSRMIATSPNEAEQYLSFLVEQLQVLEMYSNKTVGSFIKTSGNDRSQEAFDNIHEMLIKVVKQIISIIDKSDEGDAIQYKKLLSLSMSTLINISIKLKKLASVINLVGILLEAKHCDISINLEDVYDSLSEMKQSSKEALLFGPCQLPYGSGFLSSIPFNRCSNATETGEAGDETSGIKWNRGKCFDTNCNR